MLSTIEISLNDMLNRRERRAASQAELLKKFRCPLISFSMNIPGPIKTGPAIRAAFGQGKAALLEALSQQNIRLNAQEEVHEPTGDELLLSVNAPTQKLKAITSHIEEEPPLGRLFDMDVIDADGTKVSRPIFRRCLICGHQAQECARSRTHPLAELQVAVKRLLEEANLY